MIHEIKKLINDEGMVVLYYVPFDSSEGECRFQGVVHMQIDGQLVPLEFPFPNTVKTPEQAFFSFKQTARAYVNEMKKGMEEVSGVEVATLGDIPDGI